jgi:DNA-binding transcriptional LysR family regulator
MLEDINVFCAIAKHQSFAKAAKELDISTPVVTRRLARLEKSLDARLLNRTTRKVTLTEAGHLFYTEVNDLLQSLEATKEGVKSLSSKVAGTLKIGLPLSFSNLHITHSLSQFVAQYPSLKLQIITGTNQLNLLSNGFDLVIHCGELPNSSFYYKKLGIMKKVICASPSYLQKQGAPQTPEDLKQHNCLHIDTDHQTWQFFMDGKMHDIFVQGNIQINNSLDLRNLAVEGAGIVCLPYYLINKELANGTLTPLLTSYTMCTHPIYAVYPSNKFLSKKIELFLEFITRILTDVLAEPLSPEKVSMQQ